MIVCRYFAIALLVFIIIAVVADVVYLVRHRENRTFDQVKNLLVKRAIALAGGGILVSVLLVLSVL